MALPKYLDEYIPFNVQEKKDFYDLMTPTWSDAIAKQYNKDANNDFEKSYNYPNLNKGTNGTMSSDISKAINPEHYQGIVGNYQYIECMEFILGYEGLKAHLMGQIYKYMMRMGKKDSEQQELGKVIWYSRCLQILLRDGTIIGKLGELK